MLMSEYGCSLREALDYTDEQSATLLVSAGRRSYIHQENQAILIQIKIAELFSGKKVEMERPFDVEPDDVTVPLSEGALNGLMNLQGVR